MPSQYKSNREKVNEFLEHKILPLIRKKDLDYYEVINIISVQLGVSKKLVEESIKMLVGNGRIAEIRVLTVTEEQISGILKELRDAEEESKKTEKEVEEIFGDGENSGKQERIKNKDN